MIPAVTRSGLANVLGRATSRDDGARSHIDGNPGCIHEAGNLPAYRGHEQQELAM